MIPDPAHPGKNAFVQDALNLARQRRLYLAGEVIYPHIIEALELLLRSEERRLAGTPDVAILIEGGVCQDVVSEEARMTYAIISLYGKKGEPPEVSGTVEVSDVHDIGQKMKEWMS